MSFNSLDYILFLAVTLIFYLLLKRHKNLQLYFLLFASYFFYAAWNGYYLFLIIISTLIDYICGFYLYKFREKKIYNKLFLLLSIISNLSILMFFKYSDFFIENLNLLLGVLFEKPEEIEKLYMILPVGISFYTFQSLSYTLDIYKKKIKPEKSLRDFALFVAFFPQLVAGPIVRAIEFLPQVYKKHKMNNKVFGAALFLICLGISKKMLIADYLAFSIVDDIFDAPGLFSSLEVFVSLVTFHFQVYCDFSGYTDIAIGSAMLFGFTMPRNFYSPYKAHSPANFWKRWHMTLSRYVFDYLYVNIGGSKVGSFRQYMNILITFSIIGFWHGASWNFILFGVYHAVGVIFTHLIKRTFKATEFFNGKVFLIIQIVLTNIFIIFSLPLFRSPNLSVAKDIYLRVFSFDSSELTFSATALGVLVIAIFSHYMTNDLFDKIRNIFASLHFIYHIIILGILMYFVLQMATLTSDAFIYFDF